MGAVTRRIVGGRHKDLGAGDPAPGSVRQLAVEVESLREELTGMRRELDDAQNRLDFTERLLAQAREKGLLNAPKER
ncbi:MAG TPA: hypothetical protein VEH83_00230 [Gemmatimonadales bacterium]|nr:hypothetical protein [Gemmatimonadales bacterium]